MPKRCIDMRSPEAFNLPSFKVETSMEKFIEDAQITSVSPTTTYAASARATGATSIEESANLHPLFEQSRQLCEELEYIYVLNEPAYLRSHTKNQRLPDAPSVPLDSHSVFNYSLKDLDTPGLNKLNQKLWWCGANPHVKTLSHQLTFERRIVVTEDPSLHLVISENRIIYIKPLPAYLCSHAYWRHLLDNTNRTINPEERQRLTSSSLGFLRTYSQLITHRSDYAIALRNNLLPPCDAMTFESLIGFTSSFSDLPSTAVSPRWRYGELLLDTLNFYSGIFLRHYHFNRFESNYGVYFQRFFPVTLFLFASFSVILSAMQVILTGRQMMDGENQGKGMRKIMGLFEWFGTEVIAWALVVGLLFVVWWITMAALEGRKMIKVKKELSKRWKTEARVEA